MNLPHDFNSLVETAEREQLYQNLVNQLNKDLSRANLQLELDDEIPATSLKYVLQELVFDLQTNSTSDLANLLYMVDIPEKKILSIEAIDESERAEAISFLILQREWQKVWFKKTYD